jgi:hypothetical protein
MYTTTDGCSTILQAGKKKKKEKSAFDHVGVVSPKKRKKIKIKKVNR